MPAPESGFGRQAASWSVSAIKASGPVLLGGRELPERLLWVIALLGAAILSALVVAGALSEDGDLAVDERTAGVAAAGAALLRAPLLVAVAAGITAHLRGVP